MPVVASPDPVLTSKLALEPAVSSATFSHSHSDPGHLVAERNLAAAVVVVAADWVYRD